MFYSAMSTTHTERSDMDHTVLPANYTMPAFCFASIHQIVTTTNSGERHLIGACYSFIDPEGMKD